MSFEKLVEGFSETPGKRNSPRKKSFGDHPKTKEKRLTLDPEGKKRRRGVIRNTKKLRQSITGQNKSQQGRRTKTNRKGR